MISVALCTYNGGKYLKQQIDSILSQTMPVDEIVIRDDGSKDSTCAILERYASQFPQINYKRNSTNLGYLRIFESALSACRGDYIFFSDQDDIWFENKVKETINSFKTTNKLGYFSDAVIINELGEKTNQTLFSILRLYPFISNKLLDRYAFEILCLSGNFVTGATLAISREALKELIPFRTSKYILHDMWIALKLSSNNNLGYINKPLMSYRFHSSQECGLNPAYEEQKRIVLIVLFKRVIAHIC